MFYSSFTDMYNNLRLKLKNAEEVNGTKEIQNCSFTICNPRNRLGDNDDLPNNMYFSAVMLVGIITDINEVRYLTHFNKNMKNISDNGIDFYGSYGKRLKYQWQYIIDKFRYDKNTRQAIMTIYDGKRDLEVISKDIPCVVNLAFNIRNNKLNMTTILRSNDFINGLSTDVFNYTMIQEMIYNELKYFIPDLELGEYTQFVLSMHVYEKDYDLLDYKLEEKKMKRNNYIIKDYRKIKTEIKSLIDNDKTSELQSYIIRKFIIK